MSCFGFGLCDGDADERRPLLPQYNDDTTLQTRLHEKLHTYRMLRALSLGYMPSNEQAVTHLRCLLSADILNPDPLSTQLSSSGQALARMLKLWLGQFIDILHAKNERDQLQDFVWCLTKARLHVDTGDIAARATAAKARADASATYRSIQTVGSLLLKNSDFRVFLSELGTVGKEVFRDTAFSLAGASHKAGEKLDEDGPVNGAPTTKDLKEEAEQVKDVVVGGAADVAQGAEESAVEHFTGEEYEGMAESLKKAVLKLRQRPDYSDSVSTVAVILKQYLLAYSHAASDTIDATERDVGTNKEAEQALHNGWLLLRSFGDTNAWDKVEESLKSIAEHGRTDPNFDELVTQLSKVVQDMLTDASFFDEGGRRFGELREKSKELTARSSLAEDIEAFSTHLREALRSTADDEQIATLIRHTTQAAKLLSPAGRYTNSDLVSDAVNVFIPLAVQAIQHIPIPRLEVSTPAIDLLLENLVLEPGKTVNSSSFLPFKLNLSSQNGIQVIKARTRTTSSMTSLLRVHIAGMCIAAEDLGYWLRLHSGIFRVMDEGLAGFHLDERGIDITLDLEIGQDQLEKMVSLRAVHVKIHHLDYTLRESRVSFLAWLFKPIIRPLVRKALELKLAAAISDGLHFLNRELLFARERLRATRIADPDDLWTFIKAVSARLAPAPDPDMESAVGVTPSVFKGRYAPGSLVALWEEEGRNAQMRAYEYERGGWRNGVFDVRTRASV